MLCLSLAAAVRVAAESPPVAFVYVPAHHEQVDGSGYDFRVARFEVRNDQFVTFLNDALAHPDSPRGAYLYFDTTNGEVFVNTIEQGQSGPGPGGRTVKVFSPQVAGHIEFVDGAYTVAEAPTDDAVHPVSGVSWFGAVKFCNWLTLASGLPESERAYAEGSATNLSAWRPVSITAPVWATRDLTDAERSTLIAKYGYRLPMDNGENEAAPFSEWSKFATARRDGDVVVFDAIYGFGRLALSEPDANYMNSHDPFEPGTTPVGFFDGVSLLGDNATSTADTANAYQLYDVTGNVWEWMQDQSPADPAQRRNRGGSWRSAAAALRNDLGTARTATATVDSTGFRVIQSVHADLLITPFGGLTLGGPWGGPYGKEAVTSLTYHIENVVDRVIDVAVVTEAPWLSIEPVAAALAPDEPINVVVSIAPTCDAPLSVGSHTATIEFRESGGAVLLTRIASLDVSEPLRLTPSDDFTQTRLFADAAPSPTKLYTLENQSASQVSWSVAWEETTPDTGSNWIMINGVDSAQGTLDPDQSISVTIEINPDEAARLPLGVHRAQIHFTNECTGTKFTREVQLEISAPFTVSDVGPVESSGPVGGPFHPPSHEYTLINELDAPLEWSVETCEPPIDATQCAPPSSNWLTVAPASGKLAPDEQTTIEATVNPTALSLETGVYHLLVRFTHPTSNYHVDREVTLTVVGLDVRPTTAATFAGPLGGPFTPPSHAYIIHSSGAKEMFWTAQINFTPPASGDNPIAWLEVEPELGLILDPFGSQDLSLRVSDAATTLPTGTHEAVVTFDDGATQTTREVMLIVGNEGFRLATVMIPGSDVQTGGPNHDFRMGRHEVTNEAFARFLNDALRNPNNGRGSFLYHDLDSGDVYIHDTFHAEIGTDAPSTRWTTKIYNAAAGRITHNPTHALPYAIEEGFEHHPVTGVSWFGAVKFCNWLTLVQGMAPTSLAYDEGPDPQDWRAVSITPVVLDSLPGYRLPMDGAAEGVTPANEWLKAAARRGVATQGNPLFGSLYGFGRNTLTPADANYVNNGDTQTNGATPVGFYDGITQLFAGGPTNPNGNAYGLYDLTGNVAEWVHDVTHDGGALPTGATRGGHYSLPAGSVQLRNNVRQPLPVAATFAFVGFRIAQRIMPVPLQVETNEELLIAQGPLNGPFDRDRFTLTLYNDADYAADAFTLTIGAPWLVIDGVAPQLVPPHGTTNVTLRLSQAAQSLGVGRFTNEITILDNITQAESTVIITLEITEPLVVDGPDKTEWSEPYCNDLTTLTATFTMTNESAAEMPWREQSDVAWLTVTPAGGDELTGMIPGLLDDEPSARMFTITPNDEARSLLIDRHEGVVTFTNTRTGESTLRTVELTIEPPISLEPADEPSRTLSAAWHEPITKLPPINATLTRCAQCDPTCALEYEISASDAWLTVEPADSLTGSVPPSGDSIPLLIRINNEAASLPPGEHRAVLSVSLFDAQTDTPAGSESYEIILNLNDPIEIDAGDPSWDVGCAVDLSNPPTRTITITNRDAANEIGVALAVDAPWIDIDPSVQIRPGESVVLEVSLNDQAALMVGTHEVTFAVTNTLTGHVEDWTWMVDLSGTFCVSPLAGFDAYGALGRPIVPAFRLFRIHYQPEESGTIEWRATSDQEWLRIDAAPAATGTLSEGSSYLLTLSIDEATLPVLSPDADEQTLEATVTFENITDAHTTSRRIRVTQVRPPFDVSQQLVSAHADQPGGPAYSFLMAQTPVTNAEFVTFLNDALNHPSDPRGHYMFFQTMTGDVYVNDSTTGGAGPDPGARSTFLFRPLAAGAIEFDGDAFHVLTNPTDYTDHPVVGVSWYGAVKFCNWLTLTQGFSAFDRCYGEGSADDLAHWRPSGITPGDWTNRDLNDAERDNLVTSCRGYRLPMDDGFNNADPLLDTADAFNEWFKAAAWDVAAARNRLYGFGRDTLQPADANFRCSGDPFEDPADCTFGATTPVAYFDGSERQSGGATFTTNKSENAFGLMDMTGNVYQWMQGRYAPSVSIDRRALRGGSWNDPAGSNALRTGHRTLWAPPATTHNQIGFRVVRVPGPPTMDLDNSGTVDLIDLSYLPACQKGPASAAPGGCNGADQDDDGDVDLQDLAAFYGAYLPADE